MTRKIIFMYSIYEETQRYLYQNYEIEENRKDDNQKLRPMLKMSNKLTFN